jgi:hypothetical protein
MYPVEAPLAPVVVVVDVVVVVVPGAVLAGGTAALVALGAAAASVAVASGAAVEPAPCVVSGAVVWVASVVDVCDDFVHAVNASAAQSATAA